MAQRIGFVIMDLNKKFLGQVGARGFTEWNDPQLIPFESVAEAERLSSMIKTPTKIVPFVDRPLLEPEPDLILAQRMISELGGIAGNLISLKHSLNPYNRESYTLPSCYDLAMNSISGAINLLNAARQTLTEATKDMIEE